MVSFFTFSVSLYTPSRESLKLYAVRILEERDHIVAVGDTLFQAGVLEAGSRGGFDQYIFAGICLFVYLVARRAGYLVPCAGTGYYDGGS